MNSGGGKLKGAEFERLICKRLSLWVSSGREDDLFWRSAMSGGRATLGLNDNRKRKRQAGDVSAISKEGQEFLDRYFVELKFYGDLDVTSSLLRNKGLLYRFWHETRKQADKYGKLPLLIARQNYYPTMLWCHLLDNSFGGNHIVEIPLWDARCYMFDIVTAPKFIKRRVKIDMAEYSGIS